MTNYDNRNYCYYYYVMFNIYVLNMIYITALFKVHTHYNYYEYNIIYNIIMI